MRYEFVNGNLVDENGNIVNLDTEVVKTPRNLRRRALYVEVKKRLERGEKAGELAKYFRVSDSMISRIKNDKTTYNKPSGHRFKKGNKLAKKYSDKKVNEILTLRLTKKWGYSKIAKETGVSASTVKRMIQRNLK